MNEALYLRCFSKSSVLIGLKQIKWFNNAELV